MEDAKGEIAQITFFLVKKDCTVDTVLDEDANLDGEQAFRSFDFEVDDATCRFIYFEKPSVRSNPPWLDFVNERLPSDDRLAFFDPGKSANGVLLISVDNRLLAAVFGRSAPSCLDRKALEPDFGIKTAMNMCGNEEIRQTRSQSNAITPTCKFACNNDPLRGDFRVQ